MSFNLAIIKVENMSVEDMIWVNWLNGNYQHLTSCKNAGA